MALPPNMSPRQDMPPPGGFKVFDVRRKIKPARLTSIGLLGIAGAMIAYGTYKGAQQRQLKRDRRDDKRARRAYIIPFIQAEEDVRYILAEQKSLEVEEYLMRNNPNWEVGKSVYHSDVFISNHPKVPDIARHGYF